MSQSIEASVEKNIKRRAVSVFRTVEELIKLMKEADSKYFDYALDAHHCAMAEDEEGEIESRKIAAEWTKKKEEIEREYLNLTVYSK